MIPRQTPDLDTAVFRSARMRIVSRAVLPGWMHRNCVQTHRFSAAVLLQAGSVKIQADKSVRLTAVKKQAMRREGQALVPMQQKRSAVSQRVTQEVERQRRARERILELCRVDGVATTPLLPMMRQKSALCVIFWCLCATSPTGFLW